MSLSLHDCHTKCDLGPLESSHFISLINSMHTMHFHSEDLSPRFTVHDISCAFSKAKSPAFVILTLKVLNFYTFT